MIPLPTPRINSVIAATYRPEERLKKKKSSLMKDPPTRSSTRSSSRHARSSQSSQSTSSYDQHDLKHDPRGDRTPANPSAASVPRSGQPSSLASRTSSARSVSQSRTSQLEGNGDDDKNDNDIGNGNGNYDEREREKEPRRLEHRSRESASSIKDDPFFRNYQTPHSVSLGRELMAATYEHDEDDEDELVSPLSPPPRLIKKPPVDESVNLPVSRANFIFGRRPNTNVGCLLSLNRGVAWPISTSPSLGVLAWGRARSSSAPWACGHCPRPSPRVSACLSIMLYIPSA